MRVTVRCCSVCVMVQSLSLEATKVKQHVFSMNAYQRVTLAVCRLTIGRGTTTRGAVLSDVVL